MGLPLVVHHLGEAMQQFATLVGELRSREVRNPVELAFFRVLGAFLRTRPPKWEGFQIPEKLLEEPITQKATQYKITRRHGLLTNIPYLHELTRHCSGEHQHVPGEKWEDHIPEFAQVYCNLLLQSLGADRIFFLECWGNRLTKHMLLAGAQVVGLSKTERSLGRVRQTLTKVIQDQAVNVIQFWLPENRNAETEKQL